MKKYISIKFLLMVIVLVTISNSCGFFTMMLYDQIIKPTETWYFSRGFDKDLDPSKIKTQILDSCNISERAIRLARKNDHKIVCYWVDIDSIYNGNKGIRLKIVDSLGMLQRYLDARLVPDPTNGIDFSSMEFTSDKHGNLLIKTDTQEHRIYHAGDMMGLHHFDFQKPVHVHENASLNFDWSGNGYNYKWLTYEGERDDFYLINRYSYEGILQDSIYVTIDDPAFSWSDNYFINGNNWSYQDNYYVINNGKNYDLNVNWQPFGGFGKDKEIEYLTPILHTFKTNGYIENFFNNINFGNPVKAFDFLRNRKTLQLVNETVKSIGYSKFISQSEFNSKKYGIYGDHLVNFNFGYSISDITDSLIIYYENDSAPAYYKEFWSRRESEKIANDVFEILIDIQNHYSNKDIRFLSTRVNDTLKTLLTFDLEIQGKNSQNMDNILLDYYNFLFQSGMNQSAYNLIFVDSISQNSHIDKDEIYRNLQIDKKPYRINNKTLFLTSNKPEWIAYD